MQSPCNLRGKVIPVIDLRLQFSMDSMEYTERTCIIVVEIDGQSGTIQIGIVVNSVSEVLNIKGDDIVSKDIRAEIFISVIKVKWKPQQCHRGV